jgi:hypothetical protein
VKRTALLGKLAFVGATLAASTAGGARDHDGALPAGGSSGGTYRIDAMTIDGGGGRSVTGGYVVDGTVGQHDADPLQPSSGGAFSIAGGFWPAAIPVGTPDRLFADGFEGPGSGASGSVHPPD